MNDELLLDAIRKYALAINPQTDVNPQLDPQLQPDPQPDPQPEPPKELGSNIEPTIITNPQTLKEKNIHRVQTQGRQIGKASWTLNDIEYVLGKNYRKLQQPIKVVPARKTDMHSPNAKAQIIDAIIQTTQTHPFFKPIKNNPAAIKALVSNLMGMKTAEGSASNYNIGNIQVGYHKLGRPNQFWNQAVLMGDKNYSSGGTTIPYIELFRSYNSLQNGVQDWIQFLIDQNMLSNPSTPPIDFYNNLRTKGYFGSKISKSPVPKHEQNYVGGMQAGIQRTLPLIDQRLQKILGTQPQPIVENPFDIRFV